MALFCTSYALISRLIRIRLAVDAVAYAWDFPKSKRARVSGCVYWPTAEKLGHNWLNAVFGVITLPDPIHLN
jgi:hypothetical protein